MSEITLNQKSQIQLLKAIDVAEILNVSSAMAYRLIQRGEIQCVHIGSSVRVRPLDLEKFIASNLKRNYVD